MPQINLPKNNHLKIDDDKAIISCKKIVFKHLRSVIDYRVASFFARYLTARGIIPESLNSIGQF